MEFPRHRWFLRPAGSIPASLLPDFEHPNEVGHRVRAPAIESKVATLARDAATAEMPAKPKYPAGSGDKALTGESGTLVSPEVNRATPRTER